MFEDGGRGGLHSPGSSHNSDGSEFESFIEGYNYAVGNTTSFIANTLTDKESTPYLASLDSSIRELASRMNAKEGNGSDTLFGFTDEIWHQGTLMIDAAKRRTGDQAYIPPPKDFASVDVQVVGGRGYQAKNYANAKKTAFAQAVSYKQEYRQYVSELRKKGLPEITPEQYLMERGIDPNIDMTLPKYEAQARLIPADYLDDAILELRYKIAHLEATGRIEEIARYQDVLDKLVVCVEGPNGAKSIPITREESLALAELARRGKFDPARFDLTVAKQADYGFLIQNALLAGVSASVVTAALKAAPDIAKVVWSLVNDGILEKDDLENIGKKGVQGAQEGFIRGVLLASIKNACQLGYLGDELKSIALDITNSAFDNVAVVLVAFLMDTIPDSIKAAKKEMSFQEYSYRLERRVFIGCCSVGMGVWVQGLLPIVPVLGYSIGSLVGSIVGGLAFDARERVLISICVDRGVSFFGLVDQDYTLPNTVLESLGLETFSPESFESESFTTESFETEEFAPESFKTESFDVLILRRGVIGVRRIGYVIS